jgi:imidazolonepropionase-like amidohydrolase
LIGRPGVVTPGVEWIVSRLPPQARRPYLSGGAPPSDRHRQAWMKLISWVRALYEAKVPIVIGTDELAGLMVHHEMELWEQAGIPQAEIIRDATIVPARSMGLDRATGSIAIGKVADLVVVDGDPLTQIRDLRRTVWIVRGGVLFRPAPLFKAMSVLP